MGEAQKVRYTICQQDSNQINARLTKKEEKKRTVDVVCKFVENIRNKIDPRTCLGLGKCQSNKSMGCCCCEHCMQQQPPKDNITVEENQIVPYTANKKTSTSTQRNYARPPSRKAITIHEIDDDETYGENATPTNLKAIEYEPIQAPPEVEKEKETHKNVDKVDKAEDSEDNKKEKKKKKKDKSKSEDDSGDDKSHKDTDSIVSKESKASKSSKTGKSKKTDFKEPSDSVKVLHQAESNPSIQNENPQEIYQYYERPPPQILPIISSNALSYYVHLNDKDVKEPKVYSEEQQMKAPTVTSRESEMSLTIIRLNSTLPDIEEIKPKILSTKHSSKCAIEVKIIEKHTDTCLRKKSLRNNSEDDSDSSCDLVQKYVYETCQDYGGSKLSPSIKGFHLNDPSLFKAPLLVKRSHVDMVPLLPGANRSISENKKKETLGYVSESGTLKLKSSIDDAKRQGVYTYFVHSEDNAGVGCVKNRKKHYTGDSCCLKDPNERAKQLLKLQKMVKELEPGALLANVNKKFSTHKDFLDENRSNNTIMMASTKQARDVFDSVNEPKEQADVNTQTSKHSLNIFNFRKKAKK